MAISNIALYNELTSLTSQVRRLRQQLCCSNGDAGLSSVTTANSSSVIFSGDGTPGNPLTADVDSSVSNTIYTSNGTLSTNRTITLASATTLLFNSPTQATFEVNLQNSDPNKVALFRIRNGGGASGFIASVEGDSQYLKMGQYGSELKIADVKITNLPSTKFLATDATGKAIAATPAAHVDPTTGTTTQIINALIAAGLMA